MSTLTDCGPSGY